MSNFFFHLKIRKKKKDYNNIKISKKYFIINFSIVILFIYIILKQKLIILKYMVKQSIFYALLIAYSNDNYTKNIIFFWLIKFIKQKKN